MRKNRTGLSYIYGGNTTVLSQLDKEEIDVINVLIPILYEVKSNVSTVLNVMWCYRESDAKEIIKIWNDDSTIFEYSFVCAQWSQIFVEFDFHGKIVTLERISQ